MKCPHCGFVGSDDAAACRKCGKDLADERRVLGLPPIAGRPARATTSILDGPVDPSLVDDAPPAPAGPTSSTLLDLDAEGRAPLPGETPDSSGSGGDRDYPAEALEEDSPVEPADIANVGVPAAVPFVPAPRGAQASEGAPEEVFDFGEPLEIEEREAPATAGGIGVPDWPEDEWEGLEGEAAPTGDPRALPKGGFWLRVVASVVDSFFIQIVSSTILFAVLAQSGAMAVILSHLPARNEDPAASAQALEKALAPFMTGALLWTLLALVVLGSLYRPVCHWRWGKTVGKKILGLRLVTTQGARVGFARACWRDIAYVLSCLPLGLGLLWVTWDPQKQAWHDKLAATFVLKENP